LGFSLDFCCLGVITWFSYFGFVLRDLVVLAWVGL